MIPIMTRSVLAALVLAGAGASGAVYTATLDGAQEVPSNASPGTGTATVTFDPLAHTLEIDVSFAGLLGTTTASHIHAPAAVGANASVATQTPTFIGFPLGVTSGSYNETFDTLDPATYRAAFVTANGGTAAGAEAALALFLDGGLAYLNIHTTTFGGGEIRGQLTRVGLPIPEPGTYVAMVGLGLPVLVTLMRRRRAV